jgi:hypothetical protein
MRPSFGVLPALPALLLSSCAVSPPDGGTPVGPDRGDRWEEARGTGTGAVTVLYVPAAGWAYVDDRGRLTGVTVEIMRLFAEHVAAEHGVDLELRFVEESDWRTFYRRVQHAEGGVFGLGNVTITEARRSELRFSPPYVRNVAALVTHAGVPPLDRLEEMPATFAGLTALAYEGTLHEERLRRLEREVFPGVPIALAGSNQEILERVAAGGYFAYVDVYNYHAAREAGAPLRHHPVADDAAEEFGIIHPLNSDWSDVLGRFFEQGPGLTRTGSYRALLVEHLGETVAGSLLEAAP